MLADIYKPELWNSYFVMVGGGVAALTGLVFVALSIAMAQANERALGLVDFALWVHIDRDTMPDNSLAEAKKWAAGVPVPVYAMDDQTAVKVVDDTAEVVSEGHWELLMPGAAGS